MKVKVSHTEEVSDGQRKQIAAILDGEGAKKRDATREEMQNFIWAHGSDWEDSIERLGEPVTPTDDARIGSMDIQHQDPEDLIGGDDDLSDLI